VALASSFKVVCKMLSCDSDLDGDVVDTDIDNVDVCNCVVGENGEKIAACDGDSDEDTESIGNGESPPKLGVDAAGEKSSGDLTPSELESSSKLAYVIGSST
jgi:hypothetical protein